MSKDATTTLENETEPTVEPVVSTKETLEPLTEREIAIARGDNPDAVVPSGKEPDAKDGDIGKDGTDEGDDVADDGAGGTDAGESSPSEGLVAEGGTDASWVTPEHLEMAASYGLNEDDLADFKTEADFRRVGRLYDRGLLGSAASRPRQGQPQPGKQATETPDGQPASTLQLPSEAELREAGYDEEYIKIVESHRSLQNELLSVKTYMAEQRRASAVREHTQRLERFHDAVDELDVERFGRTVNDNGEVVPLDEQHNTARERLYNAADSMLREIVGRARQANVQPRVPPLGVLLRRAEQVVFAKEIREREKTEYQRRVAEQSKRRRPAPGSARRLDPKLATHDKVDEVSAIANHPAIVDWWNKTQDEIGA